MLEEGHHWWVDPKSLKFYSISYVCSSDVMSQLFAPAAWPAVMPSLSLWALALLPQPKEILSHNHGVLSQQQKLSEIALFCLEYYFWFFLSLGSIFPKMHIFMLFACLWFFILFCSSEKELPYVVQTSPELMILRTEDLDLRVYRTVTTTLNFIKNSRTHQLFYKPCLLLPQFLFFDDSFLLANFLLIGYCDTQL